MQQASPPAIRTIDMTPPCEWEGRPAGLPAISLDVHLWHLALNVPVDAARRLASCLSQEEQARSNRFRCPHDRRRFVVRRGALRTVLGWYLDTSPERLRLVCNAYGKPILDGPESRNQESRNSVQFNLSHSGELALLAVTRGRVVGVDVERLVFPFSGWPIVERFFSPREAAVVRGLSGVQQAEAFFRLWTRIEAHSKARGRGLTWSLGRQDASTSTVHTSPNPVGVDPAAGADGWTEQDLTPAPGFVGALVVAGPSDAA